MNYFVYALLALAMSIILFISGTEYINNLDYPYKSKKTCENAQGFPIGECAVWDGVQCRKGQMNGHNCEASGHYGPLLMAIFCLIFFIAFIVLGVTGFMKGHHKDLQTPGL